MLFVRSTGGIAKERERSERRDLIQMSSAQANAVARYSLNATMRHNSLLGRLPRD